MNRLQNPNMAILTLAMEKLGSLSNEMVIVGGCATGLLITDKAAAPIRATIDVDVIVQVVTRGDYYKLSERLRTKGFNEDMSEGSPICRWVCGEIILDVMPTDKSVLGFGNQWYGQAAINAVNFEMANGKSIKIISAPYFLMTKLDAFDGRGKGDYIMSHDIEDIVAVLDGRKTVLKEIQESEDQLKKALKEKFKSMLLDSIFSNAISGHVLGDNTS